MENKIYDFLYKNFSPILRYDFKYPTFLIGGSIKDLMLGLPVKDIDFIQLSDNNEDINKFIDTFNLKYTLNSFGNKKIQSDCFNIDFFKVKELVDIIEYEFDGLVYDVRYNQLLPITFHKSLKNKDMDNKVSQIYEHPDKNRVIQRYKNIMCKKTKLSLYLEDRM